MLYRRVMKKLLLPGLFLLVGFSCAAQTTPSVTVTIPPGTGGGTVTSMQVQRSTVSGGPYTVIGTATSAASLGQTVWTYVDATVQPGVTYYYVAEAVNAVGSSSISAQSAAAVIANQAPATPGTPTISVTQ
jgi:hypothetical protein